MPTRKENKAARLNMRIKPSLKERLIKVCKRQGRSVASYVVAAIEKSLRDDETRVK